MQKGLVGIGVLGALVAVAQSGVGLVSWTVGGLEGTGTRAFMRFRTKTTALAQRSTLQ